MAFGGKKAPPFGKGGVPAPKGAPTKSAPAKGAPPKFGKGGSSAPIKEYPNQAASVAPAKSTAPAPKAATKSTSAAGVNKATPEPTLSPEAEAARANQGAVTVTVVKGAAVAPPPDPRASYQVGTAEDNTPLFSFTSLASAAKKKGNPSALVQAPANSDLKAAGPASTPAPSDAGAPSDTADAAAAPQKQKTAKPTMKPKAAQGDY